MLFNPISEILSCVWSLLQTNFITALAGAGAGALGAQFITEKIKNKESLLKEIRNVNSAISLANHMCLYFFAVKSNGTKTVYEIYFKDRNAFIENLSKGKTIGDFDYIRECTLIPEPQVHIKNLRKLVFNHITLGEKAVSAFVFLDESIKLFSTSLNGRNKLIENYLIRFKNFSDDESDEETMNYFGLEHNGNLNVLHLSFVEQMKIRNDDCLFLIILLIAELTKHGKTLVNKYKGEVPEIFEPNYPEAFRKGLIPYDKRYENWRFK